MKRRYSKYNKIRSKKKSDVDRTIELFNLMNSVIINNDIDYREILDSAIQYSYTEPQDRYSERNLGIIMVNDIRHRYSNYDNILKQVNKVKRTNNDYIQYKNSVLEKIASSYPYLKNECVRQKQKLDMVDYIKE